MLIFASIVGYRQDQSYQSYTLAFKISFKVQGSPQTISDIIAPLKGIASEQQHPSDVLFRYLVAKLSQSTVLRLGSKSVVILASYKFIG